MNLEYELLNIQQSIDGLMSINYFVIYNTCSIGVCACRVILDK